MRRTTLCLFLLACCSSLLAMDVFPPAPDSHTFVKVLTRQSPFCVVSHTDVATAGSTITVTVTPSPALCPAVSLFTLRADLGSIAPGVWSVVFRGVGGSEFDRSTIIVRDGGSDIIVSPVGVRAEGGRTVQVFGAAGGTVLFDGVPATDVHVANGSLVVTPPPHAPGTVDLTVTDGISSQKAVAAFTYF